MKFLYLCLLVICFSACTKPVNYCGVYISRKPSVSEVIHLRYQYLKRKCLYVREGDCSLKINHDSTFVFTETFCGKGRVSRAGTWQLSGDDIIELNFEGKNLAKEFEVYDNRLWMETEGNTTKTKSPVVILCVLEKQD